MSSVMKCIEIFREDFKTIIDLHNDVPVSVT